MEKYTIVLSSTAAYVKGYNRLEIYADNLQQAFRIAEEKYGITADDVYTHYPKH